MEFKTLMSVLGGKRAIRHLVAKLAIIYQLKSEMNSKFN